MKNWKTFRSELLKLGARPSSFDDSVFINIDGGSSRVSEAEFNNSSIFDRQIMIATLKENKTIFPAIISSIPEATQQTASTIFNFAGKSTGAFIKGASDAIDDKIKLTIATGIIGVIAILVLTR